MPGNTTRATGGTARTPLVDSRFGEIYSAENLLHMGNWLNISRKRQSIRAVQLIVEEQINKSHSQFTHLRNLISN